MSEVLVESPNPFYARSYAVDPLGTATTVLGWRDAARHERASVRRAPPRRAIGEASGIGGPAWRTAKEKVAERTRALALEDARKSHPGDRSTWSAKAREFAPQMAAYAHVLGAAGFKVVGQWVHFTVGAGVVQVG